MSGFHPLDAVVLVVYLIGITVLGIWMARRVHSVTDYFMPRRFGKAMMITYAFGTGTASDQAVAVASATFALGLSGIWYQWLWLFATPFYWILAPIMRRLRAVTTADAFQLRFDRSVAVLFALVGIVNMAVKIGLMLKGSAALMNSATGDLINANWAIAITTVLFVIYGAAGGLGAAVVTDFAQGILTIIFSVMLLPFVMHAVGGMEGIRRSVPDPVMLSLVAPGKVGLFFIVMMGVQVLVGIVGQPFIMGVCGAGRTEADGRVGFMVGNFVKRLCTVAWCLTAMAAIVWYGNRGIALASVKPDNVYGDIARAFLPPGLMGIFLAALLAGMMSACSSFMISSSALFTGNIYRPLLLGRSSRHYIQVGRVAAVLTVAAGVLFAYWVPNVITALEIWLKIAPMMGIVFWIGLVWRRMTVAGAWAATLAGFGAWFLTTTPRVVELARTLPGSESLRLVWQDPGKLAQIYEPWTISFYLTAAVVAGVVVSLFTRPVAREQLDRFYALTRTPIAPGELITEPCTLPAGVQPPPRRMLLRGWGLELPVPSRTSLLGFAAGWLGVAILIGGFVLLVRS
jgi:Na+/proline symporter